MKSSLIVSAAGALAIGLASLAATTAPAAADSLYFGFGFGDGDGGFHHHGPRPPMYGWAPPPPAYGWAPPPPPPAYGWAPPPPPRQVCAPQWVNRNVYDDWGNVVQVVRTKEMQCYWTGPRRHRW
ncbi:hypothetical protein [Oryzibacter oryziterrae]|uniref:hypothetical protein n=1 Tax=Oryzibacter oryziterrae TaxID=2766474 RepID=UPI001F3F2418|nr:hypothetical protein [Oryzibacter oryziterrae]